MKDRGSTDDCAHISRRQGKMPDCALFVDTNLTERLITLTESVVSRTESTFLSTDNP
jgi:hypothetical protein